MFVTQNERVQYNAYKERAHTGTMKIHTERSEHSLHTPNEHTQRAQRTNKHEERTIGMPAAHTTNARGARRTHKPIQTENLIFNFLYVSVITSWTPSAAIPALHEGCRDPVFLHNGIYSRRTHHAFLN